MSAAQVREGSERETKGLRTEVARLRQDLVDEDFSDEERENEVVVRASSASYPRSYALSRFVQQYDQAMMAPPTLNARARSRTCSNVAL